MNFLLCRLKGFQQKTTPFARHLVLVFILASGISGWASSSGGAQGQPSTQSSTPIAVEQLKIQLRRSPAKHVILVSWDGGGSYYLEKNTQLKNLQQLKRHAYYTWASESESPTLTLPNHTSMVTGLAPATHQVLWNKWLPEKGVIKSKTIFDVVKAAKLSTGMYVGKEKLQHFYKQNVVDDFFWNEKAEQTTAHLLQKMARKELPNFVFLHFGEPDYAGHDFGWGSAEYNSALEVCDTQLGQILEALAKAKLLEKTAILLTADHGGLEKSHSDESAPAIKQVPLIIYRSQWATAQLIAPPISNSRIAGLVTSLLNLNAPAEWR